MTLVEVKRTLRALRSTAAFRRVSARLLSDVIEQAGRPGSAAEQVLDAGPKQLNAAAIVILSGTVRLTAPDQPERVLGPGEHYVHSPATQDVPVQLHRQGELAARVLVLTAARLARGLGHAFDQQMMALPAPAFPAVHAILLTAPAAAAMPVAAMAELLAASLTRQFDEIAVLIVLGEQGARAGVVRPDGAQLLPVPAALRSVDAIAHFVLGEGRALHCHAVVAYEGAALGALPDYLPQQRFDRIAYFADPAAPPRFPEALLWRLKPLAADPSAHRFSSIVPIVVTPPTPPQLCGATGYGVELLTTLLSDRLWRAFGGPTGFESTTVTLAHESRRVTRPRPTRWRRDTCRVAVATARLRGRWDAWAALPAPPPFLGWVTQEDAVAFADYTTAADRIARAVTNRQVGVALSGGGAFSCRLIPFLRLLGERVPIDVIGGVSGGSLLAAYFAAAGAAGMEFFLDQGAWLQVANLLAILDSTWIESMVDTHLGGARVEHTVPPLVPLTTALRPDGRPESHAVTAGTLGEGVRASGAAPVLYSPVEKGGVRFADGATAAPIPVRALWDFGADCVFACNSIPPPDRRNPLSFLPSVGGQPWSALYSPWLLGRFIDGWVSTAVLLDNASRAVGVDADVFIAMQPEPLPMLGAFDFSRGRAIAESAAHDPDLLQGIDRCVAHWELFKRTPPRIG